MAKLKTKPCDRAEARQRLQSAVSYQQVAATTAVLSERDDPYRWSSLITNCVHAGIAAADAICCAVLGEHAQGDDHQQAIELLRRVTPGGTDLAKALAALLAMKTAAGYGTGPLREEKAKRARRSADRLVSAARERVSA
jgi:hypothetical protein